MTDAVTKIKELVDKIDYLLLKKRKPNEFDIRLLTRELDKLKGKIDYSDYYNLLGRIASLINDKPNMIANFEKAIKLSPVDHAVHSSYAIALQHNGLINQSITQSEKLLTLFPNDNETSSFLIELNLLACRFRKALFLLKKLENKESFHSYILINQAIDIIEKAQLNDIEAQQLQELAYGFIETEQLYFSGAETRIIDQCIHQTIYVDIPILQTTYINQQLSTLSANNEILIFEYSSSDILDEHRKYERNII